MAKIDILLATYNSGPLLNAQIDSILRQDFTDWRLLVSDGGSTDGTLARLAEYAGADGRIQVLPSAGRLGAMDNFSRLLAAATAPLVMFSDHDDVWFPDKISRSLALLEALPDDRPRLVFTDKSVTDGDLKVIHPSHTAQEKLDAERLTVPRLLAQNAVSGCVMLFDRSLAELAGPIPPAAVMHDYYLTLTAALCGRIAYLDAPTMYYRQHGVNVLGAQTYGWRYVRARLLAGPARIRGRFYAQCAQAAALEERLRDALPPETRTMLRDFGDLPRRNWFARRRILGRYGICKNGFVRNLGMWLLI